jgi:hypothetical protein
MVETLTENAHAKRLAITSDPLPLRQALLYFGLPALLFRLSIYTATPTLIRLGLPPFQATVVSFTTPAAILVVLAFGCYKRDGYPLSWDAVKTGFRHGSCRH